MNLRFLWLLAVISFLASAPRLESCSCLESPFPGAELKQVSAVFLGVAISSRDLDEWGSRAFQFRVSRAWKGISEETAEVGSNGAMGSCGVAFKIGEEYLVYAHEARNPWRKFSIAGRPTIHPPQLWTNSCITSRAFRSAESSDLAELGEPTWVNSRLSTVR